MSRFLRKKMPANLDMKAPIAKPVAAPPHCPPIFFFLMFFFFFLDVDERERERVMLDEGVTSEAQLYAPLDEAELDDDGDEGAHSCNDGGGSAAETPIGVRCVYPLCFSFNPRRTIGNARRYTNVEKNVDQVVEMKTMNAGMKTMATAGWCRRCRC